MRQIDFWEDKMFEVVGIKSSTRVANFLNLTSDAVTIFFSIYQHNKVL